MATTFIIRPWQQTDAESLVKYANNPDIAKNLTDAFLTHILQKMPAILSKWHLKKNR